MLPRNVTLGSGLLCAAIAFTDPVVQGVEPEIDNGIELLARGPVHEGYAQPVEQTTVPGMIVPKRPPEPIDELPPEERPEGDNVVWLPGYWAWDADREDFIWVSGFWRVPPPNRFWMPGSWRKVADGWQWTSGFWQAVDQGRAEIEYVPEPPASIDNGPMIPAPSDDSIYVPGNWVWQNRYVWQPGYWTDCRPDFVWIPNQYRWTPFGCVFVRGYWDYPLAGRGILYAPAFIPRPIFARPAFCWSPRLVVQPDCMLGSLFVRRGGYYFGDYFGPAYAARGFTAWCGLRGGPAIAPVRGWYDPLFRHYQVANRADPFWRGGINDLYAGRFRGDIPVPPRTFQQQTTLISNSRIVDNRITINNRAVNLNQMTMLAPPRANPNLRLVNVPQNDRQNFRNNAQQLTNFGRQVEGRVPAAPRSPNAAQTVRIDVPRQITPRTAPAPAAPRSLPPRQPATGVIVNPGATPRAQSPNNPPPAATPRAQAPNNPPPAATPRAQSPNNPPPAATPRAQSPNNPPPAATPRAQSPNNPPPAATPRAQSPNNPPPARPAISPPPGRHATGAIAEQPAPGPAGDQPTPGRHATGAIAEQPAPGRHAAGAIAEQSAPGPASGRSTGTASGSTGKASGRSAAATSSDCSTSNRSAKSRTAETSCRASTTSSPLTNRS